MAPIDHTEQLREIPLFAELDDAALERVAARTNEVEFPEGVVLIERGQPGTGMFMIVEGTATVELPGRKVELGPSEFVGELSLLTDEPQRSVRVCSASELRCLTLSRSDFVELLESEPKIAVAMLSALARRLLDAISPH